MTPPKRLQTATERDWASEAARKERQAAPIAPAPDEDSMAHEMPERRAIRAKRPTEERIGKVEEKYDHLDAKVDAMHGDVREMRGELRTALNLIVPEHGKTARAKIDGRTKVMIAVVGAIGALAGVVVTALSGCS